MSKGPWRKQRRETGAILAAYARGVPLRDIAALHGCSISYASIAAKRHGLDLRAPDAWREQMRLAARERSDS